jgi:hypothetical protein
MKATDGIDPVFLTTHNSGKATRFFMHLVSIWGACKDKRSRRYQFRRSISRE